MAKVIARMVRGVHWYSSWLLKKQIEAIGNAELTIGKVELAYNKIEIEYEISSSNPIEIEALQERLIEKLFQLRIKEAPKYIVAKIFMDDDSVYERDPEKDYGGDPLPELPRQYGAGDGED